MNSLICKYMFKILYIIGRVMYCDDDDDDEDGDDDDMCGYMRDHEEGRVRPTEMFMR